MYFTKRSFRIVFITLLGLLFSGCATLLMLPDELSEEHYRNQAGNINSQVKEKINIVNPYAKLGAVHGEVGILPILYIYDTTNTLKKNEEAYYTSVFNNSSGSWIRPFAVIANTAIQDELKDRGYKSFIYANSDLKQLGMQQASSLIPDNLSAYKAIAYNGDSRETNYAMSDVTQFRRAILNDMQGVAFMKIQADWEPSSANRLNGDIVLNTAIQMGAEIVLCGAKSGCITAQIPFAKGIQANLFMPNRNTIDQEGLDKNYDIIKSIHGDQIREIVKVAFQKFDTLGTFKD